jgi:NitT/TauT family transport system substrate-binding protein
MSLTTVTRARAAALLFGGATIGALHRPGSAQTGAPVRIAAIPIEGAMQASYAKDMGFFAKAGIDADIQLMQGSSAIAAAVLSGSVDIGYTAVDTLATAHQKGVGLVFVAPGSEYVSETTGHDAALVVPANSTIKTARDLNGKTIGVNSLSGIALLGTRVWIDQNGGDATTVKFVEVPFATMPVALDTSRVDAVQVTEPFIGAARKSGRVLTYGMNDAVAKHFLISAWFATPQWAAAHADTVRRFAAAMREASIWANQKGNQAKSGEILTKYTKMDPAVVATMSRAVFADQLTPALLQPLIDVNARYNKTSAVPAQELIYSAPR